MNEDLLLPDAHFGEVGLGHRRPDDEDEPDPDDEPLDETPADVISMLGFDPLDADMAMDAEWDESKHPRGQPGNAGEFGTSGSAGAKTDDERGGKPPKPGTKFRVYRLGSAGNQSLEDRNAGNAQGVAEHLARLQDPDKPQFVGGAGDTLHAYDVTAPDRFGDYGAFLQGKLDGGSKDAVGRSENRGSISYSFPKGVKVQHAHVKSVPLADIMEALKGQSFDDIGTIKGAEAIRKAFEDA